MNTVKQSLLSRRLRALTVLRTIYPNKFEKLREQNRTDIALAIGYWLINSLRDKRGKNG